MTALIKQLVREAPVLLDGAWGTQLQARGLPVGVAPDPWNREHPERVGEVARAYVEAGSRIILTNTFGASRIMLDRYGLGDKVEAINRTGARISRQAACGRALVFGSIGPSGVMLAMGDVPKDVLGATFQEQAMALAEGGADALVVETMSDLDEARLAVTAAKRTGLAVVACMAYGSGRGGDRTMMGVTPEQAAEGLAEAGADVIGANCGPSIATMRTICARLRDASDLPIWMKPNAGSPEVVDGQAVTKMAPEEFVAGAVAIVQTGAAFIGGCCGSTPEFIRALAEALPRMGASTVPNGGGMVSVGD